ncbi:MAG: hypothetical protein WAU67_09040 [Terracidiphilus sp.]
MAGILGTLTNKAGSAAQVRFSLIETQQFVDGFPTLKTAEGTLEFMNIAAAYRMLTAPETKTLKGGGIQAEVSITTEDSFSVIGEVKNI